MARNFTAEIAHDENGQPIVRELTLEERVSKKIEQHEKTLLNLRAYLEIIKKVPLKEGDFCYHKEFGKGIIKHLSAGGDQAMEWSKLLEVGVGQALIVTVHGEKKVAYSEIIPYSEMGEMLYSKEPTE